MLKTGVLIVAAGRGHRMNSDVPKQYMKIGEKTIPWSEKLMQLSEITPEDMCITKLEYANNSLNISGDLEILVSSINKRAYKKWPSILCF